MLFEMNCKNMQCIECKTAHMTLIRTHKIPCIFYYSGYTVMNQLMHKCMSNEALERDKLEKII